MEQEFLDVIDDIVNNKRFKRLAKEHHHITSNKLNHSLDVAYLTYKITKKLNLDYVSATRGALLHDFFFKSEINGPKEIIFHPNFAISNAMKITKLNGMEKNIILSHMFPIGYIIPKYKESIIVDVADDIISFKDVKNLCQINIKKMENSISFILFIMINLIR